jgi:uncharacterized protein (TIGR02145 family)
LEKPEDCKMNVRIIIIIFFPIFAVAQAPQKINFQSILRNSSGEVVSNSSVSLRISILSGTITGTLVYSETHAKTTDAGGLISLQIGGGTVSSGVFGNINWGSTSHYIKLEADFSGGSNFVVLGTQELMSVPYALYASKTDTSALNLTSRLATKLNATDTASLSNRINAKAPINNPTFTGTVGGISKTMVGLSNVDNTSDAGKPISSATQTELSNKLNIADTSNMLLAYKTGLNNKLNKTDTASLSNRIDLKLNKADTASLSERINTKLNSSVIDLGIRTGDIIYWDENLRKFRILAPGTAGQVLKMSSGTNPVPVWGTDATTSVPAFSPCGTTISDIDGNSYNTVLIGAQCWTKENLRVRRYNNGTSILFDATGGPGGSSTTWQNLTIGAHTIYAHDSTTTPSNRTKYGYLYNWYAAKGIYTTGNIPSTDTLNICPSGWHVPTDAEWTTLTTDLGGVSVAGGKMKSVGTAYWNSPNTDATNSSGFSALPGGGRGSDGSFNYISYFALFWSATENDGFNAWIRNLFDSSGDVSRGVIGKSVGASVRCLRD